MATRAEPHPLLRGLTPKETGVLGVLLGCLAFLLALPPISTRAPCGSAAICTVARAGGDFWK